MKPAKAYESVRCFLDAMVSLPRSCPSDPPRAAMPYTPSSYVPSLRCIGMVQTLQRQQAKYEFPQCPVKYLIETWIPHGPRYTLGGPCQVHHNRSLLYTRWNSIPKCHPHSAPNRIQPFMVPNPLLSDSTESHM